MKKTLQNTINTINAVIELINGKYQVIYKNGTTKTYSKKPSYFDDYTNESWSKLIDNGTIYAYNLHWLKTNYPVEKIKVEEVETITTPEEVEEVEAIEVPEEVDNTNILSVNVKEERDNKRINDVLQTVLTITYFITYIDGTTQTIQGYSEKNDSYEIYKTLPDEVKKFMHKRSHKYNTGEYKTISNCYWYIEYEYININPVKPEEAVEESLEEVAKKITDINNVVARPINNTIALIEVNNNECTVIKSGFNDILSAVNYHNEIKVFFEKSKCIKELKNKIDRLKDRIEEAEMLPLEYLDGDESCKIYADIDKMKQQLKTLKKTYKHLTA